MPQILLVEDQPPLRDLFQRALEKSLPEGLSVDTAANGAEALKLLKEGARYDLVICDMLMPQMDGASFAKMTQSDPVLASVPLLLLTSLPERSVAGLLKLPNVIGYLRKPVSPAKVSERALEILGRTDDPTER